MVVCRVGASVKSLLEETLVRVAVARSDLRRQRARPVVTEDAAQVDRGVALVLLGLGRQPGRHVEARLVAGDPRQQRHGPRVGDGEVQPARHPHVLVPDVAQRDILLLQAAVLGDARNGAGVAVVDVVDLAAIRREGITDGARFAAHGCTELVVAGGAAAGEEVGGGRPLAGPGDGVDGAGEGVGAVEARERPADHLGALHRRQRHEAQRGQGAEAQIVGRQAVHQQQRPLRAGDAAHDERRVGAGRPCRRFPPGRWRASCAGGPAGCGPTTPRWTPRREW